MATHEFWTLSGVSDEQLVQELSGLLIGGARVEARIVAHLAEVEERRLHLKAATSSLFEYCLRRMGLSESEAFHRITAARLARRFPVIFELLESRAVHLSALRVLRDHLTNENHRELLALASWKSKKEVELLVARLAPRPDVAPLIRKLPSPRRELASPVGGVFAEPLVAAVASEVSLGAVSPVEMRVEVSLAELLSSGSGSDASAAGVAGEAPAMVSVGEVAATVPADESSAMASVSEVAAAELVAEVPTVPVRLARHSTSARAIEPLSATRYLFRASISQGLKDKLESARDLMSHANPSGDWGLVLERALDLLLEQLAKQRFAQTKRPRTTPTVQEKLASRCQDERIGINRPERQESREKGGGRHRSEVSCPERATAGVELEGAKVSKPPNAARYSIVSRNARREHVRNEVRRAVASRDGWQCTFVDEEGRRCACRAFLQLHHEQAHALGGPPTFENLRLLCGAHNRLLAERDFGRAHQERFTRRGAKAREVEVSTKGE